MCELASLLAESQQITEPVPPISTNKDTDLDTSMRNMSVSVLEDANQPALDVSLVIVGEQPALGVEILGEGVVDNSENNSNPDIEKLNPVGNPPLPGFFRISSVV